MRRTPFFRVMAQKARKESFPHSLNSVSMWDSFQSIPQPVAGGGHSVRISATRSDLDLLCGQRIPMVAERVSVRGVRAFYSVVRRRSGAVEVHDVADLACGPGYGLYLSEL